MRLKIVTLVSIMLLVGCGPAPQYRIAKQKFSGGQQLRLVETAKGFIGIPYRYGGKSAKGMDCSGLIGRIYTEALGMKLPRTTRGLFNSSFQIKSAEAQPGDLVFFRTDGPRIDHVGMMINRYEFIHASSSAGVVISDFKDDYYRKRFSGVRRLK